MSHHFDYPQDETLDISDAYCFAGAGDRRGPRTVFGVNTSPTYGKPWNPAGYYELKIDTDGDYVEDITYRATFPIGTDGTLTGNYANGTWSQLASLPVINGTQYAPLYFASAVLPDGRVLIMGGEFNGGGIVVRR